MGVTEFEDNPLAFEIEVKGEDNLRKALSKSEKAYLEFGKSLAKVTEGLKEVGEASAAAGRAAKDAAKAADEQSESHERESKKLTFWQKLKTVFRKREKTEEDKANKEKKKQDKERTKILKREKEALKDIGISWQKLAGLIGGATLVGGLYAAGKAFLEFYNQTAQLNATMGGQPKVMKAAQDSIQSLTGYLDFSREELVQTAKAMGDLQLVAGNTPQAGMQFKKLMKDVLHLSKAMDVSTTSVVHLYDTFKRTYGLPHHRLRGIASSMKFIQESTSMTGDEMLQFGKSLEDVMSRMKGTTKEGKADVTRDMMAMAGVLKDAGIEVGNEMPSLFSEAMKVDSDRGHEWLAMVARNTGTGMEEIRKMISEGDTVTPMQLFIKAMKKEGPEALRLNEEWFTRVTGMSHSQLTKLMKVDEGGLKGFVDKAKKAEEQRNLHEKRAQAQQHRLSTMWNNFKRIFEKVWLKIGETVITVTTKLVDWAMPKLMVGFQWLEEKFRWLTSPEGLQAIREGLTSAWEAMKNMGKVVAWLGEKISGVIKWWQGLDETTKKVILVGGGALVLFTKLGPVFGALGGKITAVVAGLTALYVGAKKVADWVDQEQSKSRAAQSKAAGTTHGIAIGMKGGEGERIGMMKSEMFGSEAKAGKSLLTSEGKVNEAELMRRAVDLIPTPMGWDLMPDFMKRKTVLEPRNQLVAQWRAGLQSILTRTDMKKVMASRDRDMKAMQAAQGQPAPAAVQPAAADLAKKPATAPPPPTVAPPASVSAAPTTAEAPQVVAVQNSGSTDSLLGQILETLKKGLSGGGGGGAKTPPGRSALQHAIGG